MAGSEPRVRRLGLFGGSFDPIHEGHLHAAREAQRAFGLDRVVFMPAFRSPFKLGQLDWTPASPEDRLAMVELATAGTPGWTVSRLELERGGASYTIDTLRTLRAEFSEPEDAELHLILGSDNLTGLAGWRDIEAILDLAQPIVVYRDGEPEELIAGLREALGDERADRIARGFLHLPPVEVSSTELREELGGPGEGGEAGGKERGLAGVGERVPESVLTYIREHGLYGAG